MWLPYSGVSRRVTLYQPGWINVRKSQTVGYVETHEAKRCAAFRVSPANLVNANFEGAMLLGAQLEEARIDGANFKDTAFL